MSRFASLVWPALVLAALAACGKQPAETQPATQSKPAATQPGASQPAATAPSESDKAATPEATAPQAPTEAISETGDTDGPEDTPNTPQVGLKLGAAPAGAVTSAQFKEGANYTRLVPAQPTSVAPGKVEVVEVFWYACPHCYHLDPLVESWRKSGKAAYVEFVRVPAMWNDALRMHARLFYTAEILGKLELLHPHIFNEVAKGNPLNTADLMAAFFKQHGVSREEFQKAFSSFAVESKLQRADFLNRRYRIDSVPVVVVNGKYVTGLDMAKNGGLPDEAEQRLFTLINELAAHEHGG